MTCVLFISGILLTGADAVRSVKQLQPAIERNDYGKGSKTEVLDVKVGNTKKKIRTDIEVSERRYTTEEIQELFGRIIRRMDRLILNENQTPDHVETDLNLITEIPGEPVTVSWELDRYDVMNVKGEIQEKNIAEKGTLVKLNAVLTYTENEKEQAAYQCVVCVYPKKLSGEEEIKNGSMIVYTSADSVLQICGNEETFDLQNLYRCCEIARKITLKDEWRVGRVIARPYVGKKKGEFVRTSNRHDYALKPTGLTALNALKDSGLDVISVGKINDIFCGEGITEAFRSKSSVHGMEQTIDICEKDFKGLCFVNLVDFDALWGHRRNVTGYGEEIEKFDKNLGILMEKLRDDDLLILTADHGNDPTYKGTDHTREYVPFIAYSKSMKGGGAIEEEATFAVIGATITDNFGVKMPEGTIGHSILEEL